MLSKILKRIKHRKSSFQKIKFIAILFVIIRTIPAVAHAEVRQDCKVGDLSKGKWVEVAGDGCVGGEQTVQWVNLARVITSINGSRMQVQTVVYEHASTGYVFLEVCEAPPVDPVAQQALCEAHLSEWCSNENSVLCPSPFAAPCETFYGGGYNYDPRCTQNITTVVTCAWDETSVASNVSYQWKCNSPPLEIPIKNNNQGPPCDLGR